MKSSHFEVSVALGAAGAAGQRDEPTQREPATFHSHAVGPWLVRTRTLKDILFSFTNKPQSP